MDEAQTLVCIRECLSSPVAKRPASKLSIDRAGREPPRPIGIRFVALLQRATNRHILAAISVHFSKSNPTGAAKPPGRDSPAGATTSAMPRASYATYHTANGCQQENRGSGVFFLMGDCEGGQPHQKRFHQVAGPIRPACASPHSASGSRVALRGHQYMPRMPIGGSACGAVSHLFADSTDRQSRKTDRRHRRRARFRSSPCRAHLSSVRYRPSRCKGHQRLAKQWPHSLPAASHG